MNEGGSDGNSVWKFHGRTYIHHYIPRLNHHHQRDKHPDHADERNTGERPWHLLRRPTSAITVSVGTSISITPTGIGSITVTGQPGSGNTVSIGGVTYTFEQNTSTNCTLGGIHCIYVPTNSGYSTGNCYFHGTGASNCTTAQWAGNIVAACSRPITVPVFVTPAGLAVAHATATYPITQMSRRP